MPKEMRISATIAIPDDPFEAAHKMSAVKPYLEAFQKEVEKLGGKVAYEVVTPRQAKGMTNAAAADAEKQAAE